MKDYYTDITKILKKKDEKCYRWWKSVKHLYQKKEKDEKLMQNINTALQRIYDNWHMIMEKRETSETMFILITYFAFYLEGSKNKKKIKKWIEYKGNGSLWEFEMACADVMRKYGANMAG